MDNKFILNVLSGVFAKDANSFSIFLQEEKEQALKCSKQALKCSSNEMLKHFNEINEQLEFVYTKIEEDAVKASSQKVELLNITNVIYND